jgi:hypothetical protein
MVRNPYETRVKTVEAPVVVYTIDLLSFNSALFYLFEFVRWLRSKNGLANIV